MYSVGGSLTFSYGSGSADPYPVIFVIDLQDATKNYFFLSFCLLLFEGTFTSIFKDKKSLISHKTDGIEVFLTIFA
jgi:hypothetical protein